MASSFFNRMKFLSTSSGTAAFGVGAAVTGFRSPAAISPGTTISYTAELTDSTGNITQWETGQGVFNGTIVNRTTPYEGSSTLPVSFGSNPVIWFDVLAQDMLAAAQLGLSDQIVSGGANVISATLATGNVTIDCGKCPLQFITNGGAFTITAPSSDGTCMLLITNNASAGAVTFSGFSVGSSTGDSLTTTNTSKFTISIWRINGTSGYRIAAHQ